MRRRQFFRSALAAAALPAWAQKPAIPIAESDLKNAKLCHRLDAKSITDDDLRFLQQIGLKWVRLEFASGDVTFDALRGEQQRYAQFGMRIHSGVHYSYRSQKID